MDTPVLTDQQKFTFTSTVQTLGAISMSYWERQSIGRNGRRDSRESMQSTHLDDVSENIPGFPETTKVWKKMN